MQNLSKNFEKQYTIVCCFFLAQKKQNTLISWKLTEITVL